MAISAARRAALLELFGASNRKWFEDSSPEAMKLIDSVFGEDIVHPKVTPTRVETGISVPPGLLEATAAGFVWRPAEGVELHNDDFVVGTALRAYDVAAPDWHTYRFLDIQYRDGSNAGRGVNQLPRIPVAELLGLPNSEAHTTNQFIDTIAEWYWLAFNITFFNAGSAKFYVGKTVANGLLIGASSGLNGHLKIRGRWF